MPNLTNSTSITWTETNGNLSGEIIAGLDNLSDVDLTTVAPTLDDVLTFDGTKWVPGSGGGETLGDLLDVTLTSLMAGELLAWDGAAWINRTLAEAGIAAASHAHVKADITDFAHTHLKAEITDFAHTHAIADVTNLQTTLDGKQATITGGASTITSLNLTASRALISNASGKVAVSAVTSTELGYLDGVTSSVQTQLNGKLSTSGKAADSNLLDGIDSSAFLRSNTSDTFTGTLTLNGAMKLDGITIDEFAHRPGLLEVNREGTAGWGGYGITFSSSALWTFMANQTNAGLYDDYNSNWILYHTENGATDLRHNGTARLTTSGTGVTVSGEMTSTGAVRFTGGSRTWTWNPTSGQLLTLPAGYHVFKLVAGNKEYEPMFEVNLPTAGWTANVGNQVWSDGVNARFNCKLQGSWSSGGPDDAYVRSWD